MMRRAALGFAFVAIFASVLSAQNPGVITGTVTDPNNRVVANAQVAATNQDTNAETDVTTGNNGQFSFPNVPAGTYTVDVAAPGLDGEADDVALNEGATANVRIRLEAAEGDDSATGNQGANPAPAQQQQNTSPSSASAPANQANPNTAAQANQSTPPGMIDLGAPPLAPEEMNAVMTWIAAQVAAINLPYCYRQSYGNGAGEPYTCNEGYDRNGLLCYPKCRDGFAGNGPVCWGVCPAGSNDIGAFCQKSYAQKLAGGSCPAGFRLVTGRGSSGCAQACPDGWNDTGTGCTKPSYGRGAGEPLAMGVVRPAYRRTPAGHSAIRLAKLTSTWWVRCAGRIVHPSSLSTAE